MGLYEIGPDMEAGVRYLLEESTHYKSAAGKQFVIDQALRILLGEQYDARIDQFLDEGIFNDAGWDYVNEWDCGDSSDG